MEKEQRKKMTETEKGNFEFVSRLKELMKEQRYTQAKMCELCGITEAAFSRYITLGRVPRADILARIANTLHTTSDYLTGNDTHYGFPQIKALLADSLDDLSKNQKDELIALLDGVAQRMSKES